MGFVDITIKWSYIFPTSASNPTLVKYRPQGSQNWITPTSSPNPTTNEYYTLVGLDDTLTYEVLLTHVGDCCNCSTKSIYFTISTPSNCFTCPSGYTLSPDQTYCYTYDIVAPTQPTGGTPDTTVAKAFTSYSFCGTLLMNPGYSANGVGTINMHLTTFWWSNPNANTLDGPLNRCGVWASTEANDQDVGFSVCVNLPFSQVYYVGIAGDNYVSIKVDGNLIVQQDPIALANAYCDSLSCTPCTGGYTDRSSFIFWYIYPVQLTAGPHFIELVGHNVGGPAAIGAEIYANTPSEIAAAQSYNDLNLIFSTKDYVGQPIQIGNLGYGYTCPSGYVLDSCSTPYQCRKLIVINSIPC